MTLGELVDKVAQTIGCSAADAMKVAAELFTEDRDYTNREIAYVASKLDVGPEDVAEPVPDKPELEPELEMDPAKVMKLMYRACPRAIAVNRDGVPDDVDVPVHMPRIGRAPKESPFFNEDDVDELLAGLPDETKLMIGAVDLVGRKLTVTLYDEANDVDRDVGPIDLDRYENAAQLNRAINVLMSRLQSRVLPADFN